jgi:hypothetical protein
MLYAAHGMDGYVLFVTVYVSQARHRVKLTAAMVVLPLQCCSDLLVYCGTAPQIKPGVYDERGIKSLDFVLEVARKYGLQVRAVCRQRLSQCIVAHHAQSTGLSMPRF